MPSNKIELSPEEGMRIADKFMVDVGIIFAKDFMLAGSIRRLRPIVHDIDIVVTLRERYLAPITIERDLLRGETTCDLSPDIQVIKWGEKLASLIYRPQAPAGVIGFSAPGIPIDLYFSTPETFNTLLLIRTGSKENNIRLCSIAKAKGWKLHASGDGLFNERGDRIAGDSERSIYDALGVPWQEPWEREVPR